MPVTAKSEQAAAPSQIAPASREQAQGARPRSHRVGDVAFVQRTAGNRAAARLLAIGQPKLEVGAANDVYEREADDVAQRVVAALGRRAQPSPAKAGGGDALPGDADGPVVQRIQRRVLGGSRMARKVEAVGEAGGEVDANVEGQIAAARSGGSAMPAGVRAPMESAFGSSFGDVKVHTGAKSDQLNDAVSAKAFTVGNDIFFKGGMPDTSNAAGQQLVAHELTHVVQQRGGQVARAQRLFGKKKPKPKGPVVGAPTNVKDTTGEALVAMVQAADAKTRAFMVKNAGFMAKVQALEPGQQSIVMALLDAAKDADPTAGPDPEAAVEDGDGDGDGELEDDTEAEDLAAAQAEATAQAEAEAAAQAKAQADAEAKAEAEAQAKAEAEAQAKAEADAKADAEAKSKAEADAKAEAEEKAAAAEAARLQKEAEDKAAAEALAAQEAAAAKLKAEADAEALRIANEDKKYKTTGEIDTLTMPNLVKYVEETPTWDQRSTITPDEKAAIRQILAFAQEPGVAATLDAYRVTQLRVFPSPLAGVLTDLRVYVAAVSRNDPIALNAVTDLTKAVKAGDGLKRMLAGFPKWVLKSALKQDMFTWLNDRNLIDAVISYYQTCSPQPVFQATNGADFRSYAVARSENWDPATYNTKLPDAVRNYHRFPKVVLDTLAKNFADGNTAKKPMTLILHTAVDHNGAFHRDPKLSALMTNANTFTLMIEGGETLAAYQSQIAPLAASYGVNGKIDQVMFAGHGDAKSIEMAGTVSENAKGGLQEDGEAINIDGSDRTTADALFDEVLASMNDTAAAEAQALLTPGAKTFRRILFNACLTNSNVIDMELDEDNAAAQEEIRDYLLDNASLATYLGNKAKAQGFTDVKSLGANASITQVDLNDPSGALDLKTDQDPKVTADKIEYAEEGREPLGVMRAALEAWAYQPDETFAAMARRVAAATTDWDDLIITSIFGMMIEINDAGESNIATKLQFFADVAAGLSELKNDAHCLPGELAGLLVPEMEDVLGGILVNLKTSDQLKASKALELVVAQLLLGLLPTETNMQNGFLNLLRDKWDAKTAIVAEGKYVDVKLLDDLGALDPMLSGPASEGRTILAIIAILDGGAPDIAKTYLKSKLVPAAAEIPALPEVPAVEAVPEQPAPRAAVAAVPLVPGRAKVVEIPGKRVAAPAIKDAEALDALDEVKAPMGPITSDGAGPTATAPGRPGRAKRDAADKIPAVKTFFPAKMNFAKHVGKRVTEDELIAKLG